MLLPEFTVEQNEIEPQKVTGFPLASHRRFLWEAS